MSYAQDLLRKATDRVGSRYALAKATELDESDLSKAANGKRQVPASWVLRLARVAGVDPTEAMELYDLEQAEKKRARRSLLRSAVAGAVAICAGFAMLGKGPALLSHMNASRVDFDNVYIVSIVVWIITAVLPLGASTLRWRFRGRYAA